MWHKKLLDLEFPRLPFSVVWGSWTSSNPLVNVSFTIISILQSLAMPAFWLAPKNRSLALIALFWACNCTVLNNQSQSRKNSNSQSQHSKEGCTTCENFENNENFDMSLLQNAENTNDKDLNKITYSFNCMTPPSKMQKTKVKLFW